MNQQMSRILAATEFREMDTGELMDKNGFKNDSLIKQSLNQALSEGITQFKNIESDVSLQL
jgi:hypothetical protein